MLVVLVGPPYSATAKVVTLLETDHSFRQLNLAATENSGEPRKAACRELLHEVLRGRREENYVLTGIRHREELSILRSRPGTLVVSVEADIFTRMSQCSESTDDIMQFFAEDQKAYLPPDTEQSGFDLAACLSMADLRIDIRGAADALHVQVDAMVRMGLSIVRPNWDTYFMRLAFLASSRSNCIKRRVGAIVVHENRIVATGYNGTPSGTKNCYDGGCARCADPSVEQGKSLDACMCIHAEANALLEAGRDRCRSSTLYCTSLPCLSCSKLIVQTGINRVVYCLDYDTGGTTTALFKAANVNVNLYTKLPGAVPLHTVLPFFPT